MKKAAGYRAVYAVGKAKRTATFSASSDANAVRYATGLLRAKHGGRCVSVQRTGKPAAKKNPAGGGGPELAKAARAFEDFTGHRASSVARGRQKSARAGWLLGTVAEIGYIATRDGERALYVHKFKSRSRPQLVSSADGSQLYLLGGAYSVTERGIEDSPAK